MRAKIRNDKSLLFPGSFVELQVFVNDKIPVLAVHPDQVSQNQQGEYVLVVNEKNQIETRQIKSSYANNDLVIIYEGLKEGDRVLVGTVNALHNGTEVVATEVENPIKA